MTNLSAATPTPPERPHLWMLAGRLFVAELILGGLILLFGLVGMLTGLFQRGTIVGTTHRLFGWPYFANGFWSMSADVILIATLAAIGSWIVVGALRERGFEVAVGLVFVALLAGPTGLPELLFVGRRRLLISFLVALALLFVASRVRTPRWNPSRRLKKVLAAVWMLAVVCSLSYGVLHPFDSNMASGARSTTRPDGEQWELPRHGLSIETLFIHNSGFLEATLIGVEAPLNNQRLKSVLVGQWEPWFGPKNAVWPDGLPQEFIKTPFRRLALPAHKTRAITVVFQPGRCRHVDDLAPVRSVRLRYRLGSMTLTQPFQLADPLALCDLARAT